MIFPTTFITTLFLAHIARALPQPCSDSTSPESQYNLVGPEPVVANYKAVYNPTYDNPSLSLNGVACSNLQPQYATLGKLPLFPHVGGAINTTFNSPNCGAVWKITNLAHPGLFIYYVGIDASSSFDLSLKAFTDVGGSTAAGSVAISAVIVAHL
jgi:hypothetical protein